MEQIGWDGKPRPKEIRRKVSAEWPEVLEPLSDICADQTFKGPSDKRDIVLSGSIADSTIWLIDSWHQPRGTRARLTNSLGPAHDHNLSRRLPTNRRAPLEKTAFLDRGDFAPSNC